MTAKEKRRKRATSLSSLSLHYRYTLSLLLSVGFCRRCLPVFSPSIVVYEAVVSSIHFFFPLDSWRWWSCPYDHQAVDISVTCEVVLLTNERRQFFIHLSFVYCIWQLSLSLLLTPCPNFIWKMDLELSFAYTPNERKWIYEMCVLLLPWKEERKQ